jgi:hypothetical protein
VLFPAFGRPNMFTKPTFIVTKELKNMSPGPV